MCAHVIGADEVRESVSSSETATPLKMHVQESTTWKSLLALFTPLASVALESYSS